MQGWLRYLLRPTIALLLSPLGLVLMGAARLLIVSDDRPVTATAIASSGGYFNTLLGTLIPLIPIFLPYVALLFLLFRRFILCALSFIVVAFISPAQERRLPASIALHGRRSGWREALDWIDAGKWQAIMLGLIVVCIFISWISRDRWGYQWFSFLWIIVAAFIFLPVIVPIYPIPRAVSFYVTTLRQPWLPEEKLTLISGKIDYGYVLAISNNWFVELTSGSRTIRYIPAGEVVSRDVCKQQEESFSPLIALPQVTRVDTPSCPRSDGPLPPAAGTKIPRTPATSYLSHGESLNVISSAVHVTPDEIISETNAYQHQRLSAALRAYEISGDWNAETPSGQHFWYYPPSAP
jgi:hypothetical protein